MLSKHLQCQTYPDNKVHGDNMGPIWGRQDPGGPHVGPMNFAIWVAMNPSGAVMIANALDQYQVISSHNIEYEE